MTTEQKLTSLVSVGPAIAADFEILGITKVEQLKGRTASDLYDELQRVTGKKHDICVQDVFTAAIAQAENPNLPDEQRQWFYYSKLRKGQ